MTESSPQPSNADLLAAINTLVGQIGEVRNDQAALAETVATLGGKVDEIAGEVRTGFDEVRRDIAQLRADVAGVKVDTGLLDRHVTDLQNALRRHAGDPSAHDPHAA